MIKHRFLHVVKKEDKKEEVVGPPKFEFGFLAPHARRMDQATLRPRSEIFSHLKFFDLVDKVRMG